MADTMYLDASKDAVALVATLRKGDTANALLLASFYRGDPMAQEALCMALAAFANACLTALDNAPDSAAIPSGDSVLKSVLISLATE